MPDRPLSGRRVVVTRPDGSRLADALERLGADVQLVPLIEIRAPEDRRPLDAAAAAISTYDWVVLTSANGVAALGGGIRGIGEGTRVAVVGPVTAEAVRAQGVEPSYVGERSADDIPDGLGRLEGARVLLPQADIADPRLADELRASGAAVDVVVAYRTSQVEPSADGIRALRDADAVVLASGSAAHSLATAACVGDSALIVCIGSKTAAVARQVGLNVGLVADEATADGIIRSLVSHFGETT